ncbi:uncharacterized protein J4E79_011666 [Alternaria viburni]|uniref:uncharacterized protein n=1 Tax=Alternaria viburni TaxID=566460 RepID=UPI0020C37452|nr:uncharacterized protein J4E79_011666 [Alternaria viburni]KAI4641459.1 hypothetical protein J4E79_011666 [Alternaria viburni]
MATPPPDGPSSRPIISSTRGGLSSPQLEVAVSSDSHSPLSEAAHVPTDPALCQDIHLSDSQHDLFATKAEFDAYSEPFDFDHPGFLEDFEPYRDTVLEQAWVNEFPASLGGLSHSLTQSGATKRAISSSPPSGFSHKVRKPKSRIQVMITDAVHHSDAKTTLNPHGPRMEINKHHQGMISQRNA